MRYAPSAMGWMDDDLRALEAAARLRTPNALAYEDATHARLRSRTVTVLCGNDYLGLRHHPALLRAANEVTTRHGSGTGASRLISGNLTLHDEVEAEVAEVAGASTALLCTSGYAANVGALAALLGPDDVVCSDALNHASLIDGMRLGRATVAVFAHNDMAALRDVLARSRGARRRWIVTEGLFSMDGDLAPLDAIAELAAAFDAHRYVDEAHAFGVLGPGGTRSSVGAPPPDVRMLGFGKALGAGGAALVGGPSLRPWLWNHSRSFIFSTGVPPGPVAAAREALRVLRDDPELLPRLRRNIAVLRDALGEHGVSATHGHPEVPIVPVVLGDDARTARVSARLLEAGWFVHPIRPPTVPEGTARLRVTVSAAHDPMELRAFARCLGEVLRCEG